MNRYVIVFSRRADAELTEIISYVAVVASIVSAESFGARIVSYIEGLARYCIAERGWPTVSGGWGSAAASPSCSG